MAIVTKDIGYFPFDDAGTQTAILQLDYDDALLTPTTVRCINTAPSALTVSATSTIGSHIGQTVSHSFAANATSVVNLPSGQATRWGVTITPQGRVDGVEMQVRWGP